MEKLHKVLILSRGDSARGPLAAALVSILSKGHMEVHRAGISPRHGIHPFVVQKMRELGVTGDISQPCGLYRYWSAGAPQMDYVVSICFEACHVAFSQWPGAPFLHQYTEFCDFELFGRPNPNRAFLSDEARMQLVREDKFEQTFNHLLAVLGKFVSKVMRGHDPSFVLGQIPALARSS
jgi:protein-tyrosine-phosphatase